MQARESFQRLAATGTALWPFSMVAALLAGTAITPAMAAGTDNPFDLGTLSGGTSIANGVSADGTTVVGTSDTQAFRFVWGGGRMEKIKNLYGGEAEALGVNADGSVVVGAMYDTNMRMRAFRWAESGGGTVELDPNHLYFNSRAYAVSADGTVVVGRVLSDAYKAFRWTAVDGLQELGRLPGTRASYATAVNSDGTVIVGSADDGTSGRTNSRAFRWTLQSLTMTDLGTLNGGTEVHGTGVSGDGSVVVGYANDGSAGGAERAFRWTTASNTMTSLGILGGGSVSRAYATNSDGSIVVGSADIDGQNQVTRAIRWSQSDGRMLTIEEWLRENGVLVGNNLTKAAYGVSSDGSVVVGQLQNDHAFIARGPVPVQTPAGTTTTTAGLMDVPNFQQSLAGTQRLSGQLQNADLAINGEHCSPLFMRLEAGQSSAWFSGHGGYAAAGAASGGFGGGEFGFARGLEDGWNACIGGGGQYMRMDTPNGGNATFSAGYVAPDVSRELGKNVVATLSGYFSWGRADFRRGYLNGLSNDSSFGSAATQTLGFRARLDWSDAFSVATTSVSPFVSYTYLNAQLAGYTEAGGSFPVRFNGVRENSNVIRIGADARTALNDVFSLITRFEYGHRFERGGAGVSGQILGLSAFSLDGSPVQQDWVRGGIGASYKLGNGDGLLMLNSSNQNGRNATWVSASYRLKF